MYYYKFFEVVYEKTDYENIIYIISQIQSEPKYTIVFIKNVVILTLSLDYDYYGD
jgi:hypothetical protein